MSKTLPTYLNIYSELPKTIYLADNPPFSLELGPDKGLGLIHGLIHANVILQRNRCQGRDNLGEVERVAMVIGKHEEFKLLKFQPGFSQSSRFMVKEV